MEKLQLFRIESLWGEEKRYIYLIKEPPLNYCKKTMDIEGLSFDKIRLTLEGEEMKPDKKVIVSSLEEILSFSEKEVISICSFMGRYDGKKISIVVGFDMDELSFITENPEDVKKIKNILEDM